MGLAFYQRDSLSCGEAVSSPGCAKPRSGWTREKAPDGESAGSHQLCHGPVVRPRVASLPPGASLSVTRRDPIGVSQRPFLEFFNFQTQIDVKFLEKLK